MSVTTGASSGNASATDHNSQPNCFDQSLTRARKTSDAKGRPVLHTEGAGTPFYIAPEQGAEGKGDYDFRVDIYALGIVFLDMWWNPIHKSHQKKIKFV